MSTVAAQEHEEDHGHHHKETFVTKYIFSQDHKMISKQYLITGLFMGIIGIAMSLLFRLQLAWPEQPFGIFEVLLVNGLLTGLWTLMFIWLWLLFTVLSWCSLF